MLLSQWTGVVWEVPRWGQSWLLGPLRALRVLVKASSPSPKPKLCVSTSVYNSSVVYSIAPRISLISTRSSASIDKYLLHTQSLRNLKGFHFIWWWHWRSRMDFHRASSFLHSAVQWTHNRSDSTHCIPVHFWVQYVQTVSRPLGLTPCDFGNICLLLKTTAEVYFSPLCSKICVLVPTYIK